MLETVQAIGAALTGIKTITEITSTIKNTEIRQELNSNIAELQQTLIAAQQQTLELQQKYERLLREHEQLKEAKAPKPKPKGVKWGCYEFEGDNQLYCTACYDTKGQKSVTTRVNSRFRMCPVCQAVIGVG